MTKKGALKKEILTLQKDGAFNDMDSDAIISTIINIIESYESEEDWNRIISELERLELWGGRNIKKRDVIAIINKYIKSESVKKYIISKIEVLPVKTYTVTSDKHPFCASEIDFIMQYAVIDIIKQISKE